MKENEVTNELYLLLKNFKKATELIKILENDKEVNNLLELSNMVTMLRLHMNDHGKTHSKIVSLNSIKIYNILSKNKILGNIQKEGLGGIEEEYIALLLGSYLHDIGNSISRENHELLGIILAKPIIERILKKIKIKNMFKINGVILEEILCHMGHYVSSSLEAKIVACADGTDMTKGRARIPYESGKADIHSFSAMAIEDVSIKEGERKPVRIEVKMNDTAGIFQIEEILNKKIEKLDFSQYVEVVGIIKNEKIVKYF
ncbi:MAG: HD domain-containing protein [Candidatus Micrarchaeales archaeon]